MRGFYGLASFPGVLGAIDCTHVAIQSPGGVNGELFRNRKGYFSLNIQGVVSATLVFENVVSRWYGSAHDATIFANSRLNARFESGEFNDFYLLGDAGYPCKNYLLTPLAATPTAAQRRYNYCQIRTRNPVERAFGVLKRRFPCLKMGLRVKVTECQLLFYYYLCESSTHISKLTEGIEVIINLNKLHIQINDNYKCSMLKSYQNNNNNKRIFILTSAISRGVVQSTALSTEAQLSCFHI